MLLMMNSNAMSVRKNLVQPVITKNMFFFMKKKKKKFVCDECGQRFTYPSQLNSHAQVHLPQKIHKCPNRGCSKTFKCSAILKLHFEKQ